MILDDTEPKSTKKQPSDLDYLRQITILLSQLLNKPTPKFPELKSPNVVVNPPEVIVNTPEQKMLPPPKQVKKWSFKVIRDFNGYTKEIIATAME